MHSLPQVYWTKSITTKDNDFLTSQPNTFCFGSKSPGGRGEVGWGGGLARPRTQGPALAHRPSGSLSDSGILLMMEKQCIEPRDPPPPKADLELKLGPSGMGAGVVGVRKEAGGHCSRRGARGRPSPLCLAPVHRPPPPPPSSLQLSQVLGLQLAACVVLRPG